MALRTGLVLLFMSLSLSANASEGAPFAEETIHETIRLVRQDCGSCHGMSLQGGLGTPLTREALTASIP